MSIQNFYVKPLVKAIKKKDEWTNDTVLRFLSTMDAGLQLCKFNLVKTRARAGRMRF